MPLISKVDPHLFLIVKLDPSKTMLEKGFTRDVINIGHCGTGGLGIIIRNANDFEKAKRLIERGYVEN